MNDDLHLVLITKTYGARSIAGVTGKIVRMTNTTGTIYALSLDGVTYRYVGQAKNLTNRLRQHRYDAMSQRDLPVYRWIRKHGWDAIKVTVLDSPLMEVMNAAEVRWISELTAAGADLLNCTQGGEGIRGWTHSEETRAKISSAHVGMTYDADTREKVSEARQGKQHSAETRAKIGEAARSRSPESNARIAEANRGRKHTPEAREKIRQAALARYARRTRGDMT